MSSTVEIRSLTGQNYKRASALWTTEWKEVTSKDFTKDQLELLRSDPHLEVRVDGVRFRNGVKAAADSSPALRELTRELAASRGEIMALKTAHAHATTYLQAQLDAATKANAELAARLTALEGASKTESAAAEPAKSKK